MPLDPIAQLSNIDLEAAVRRLPTTSSSGLVHVFDRRSIVALKAAVASGRPLLVRGEPGVGKTQLADAAAVVLGRPILREVVDSRTEARDLLYKYDAVRRLAEAQTLGVVLARIAEESRKPQEYQDGWLGNFLKQHLDESHFVSPGVIWRAFASLEDPASSFSVLVGDPWPQTSPQNGHVVLIDEIDKAEVDLPNGLLGVLGAGEFKAPGYDQMIRRDPRVPEPLVIITTNQERSLPNAFIRRCVVLDLWMPDEDPSLAHDDPSLEDKREANFKGFLTQRGVAHFPELGSDVLREAADQVWDDRRSYREQGRLPLPGQAEYLDLLRAMCRILGSGEADRREFSPLEMLRSLAEFIVSKHGRSE
jgi:MoxR-like ATPase